jgi:hypothetical protein
MPTRRRIELGLYDARGHRKYLTAAERTAFLTAAEETPREVRTLFSLLAHTCGPQKLHRALDDILPTCENRRGHSPVLRRMLLR